MGCYNSTVVPAGVDEVWKRLRNFHDMDWAPDVIESCEVVGDIPGTQIGAKRILNQAFHETLLALDDTERTLKYSIDDGPEAVSRDNVSDYLGEVSVFPVTDDNRTFVLWKSSWGDSGGGVAEFCDPIYKALLDALKSHFAK
ncbi:MAG: SRPBCC family protein [Gammaproteobacteria bacterium]